MTSKKHRMIVYGVAFQLLVIAIVCYAAFPVEKPETPVRLMYQTKAGKVLFDHQAHASEDGFGLDCFDCHHHPPDEELDEESDDESDEDSDADSDADSDEDSDDSSSADADDESDADSALVACGDCHLAKPMEEGVPESCLECHEAEEVEDSEYPKRSDALHQQCTDCHNEFGKGPIYQNSLSEEEIEALKTEPNEWVDCNKCHVL